MHFFGSASDFPFPSVYGIAVLLILAVWLLAAQPLRADSISTSSLQVSNLTITPSAGTLVYLSSWTAQAFAQAQNSLGENQSQYSESYGGIARASASVQFASAQSTSDAGNMILMASGGINIPDGAIAATSIGQNALFNTFEITGGGGPVNVSFEILLNSMQYLFTDLSGQSAQSHVGFDLTVDGHVVLFRNSLKQIGPNASWNSNFSGELSHTITLDENEPYRIHVFADRTDSAANVPEPPTIALTLLATSMGFIRRLRVAKGR